MEKITVMIVDDEKLAVDDMVNMIDWAQNDFVLLDTAVNGKQAFAKYEQMHPQIIFTDIKMPYMDGIELIKKIRERDTQTKIVLLTSYKDFAYAQTAIKYGITDYVLKSDISKQTIAQILKDLKRAIAIEHTTQSTVHERMLADYFAGVPQAESVEQQHPFNESFCYVCIDQDIPIPVSGEQEEDVPSFQMANIAQDMENAAQKLNMKIIAESMLRPRQILQILKIDSPSEAVLACMVTEYALCVQSAYKQDSGNSCTVYYVAQRMGIQRFRALYQEKIKGFAHKYFFGTGRLYNFCAISCAPQPADIIIDHNIIEEHFEKCNTNAVWAYLDEVFSQVIAAQSYSLLLRVSRSLYDILSQKNKQLPDQNDQLDLSYATNHVFWNDLVDVHQWLKAMYASLLEKTAEKRSLQYSKPVLKAMQVIWDHYADRNLNINFIADLVHLSVGHLSLVFKKETGRTVNDYITETRIERAKKLLEGSDCKIYEVAEAVGYKSSQYFSQVFFKVTGCSPAEFQKRSGVKK